MDRGCQRIAIETLQAWEEARFGMFVHYGMSTFLGEECPDGTAPRETCAVERPDTEQWVRLAKDAGMRYVVLTAKHVAGHCLWPSRLTDYRVQAGDVVADLAEACARHGLVMGLYYCSWDDHHRFGTVTAGEVGIFQSRVTPAYLDFQLGQLDELLTGYGPLFELWLDIPQVLGPEGRRACYDLAAARQPTMPVVMNQGCRGSSTLDLEHAWPTDVATRERQYPECQRWGQGANGTTIGHDRWFEVEGRPYYVPTEVCDCIGYHWFHDERDRCRSPKEVAAMRVLANARGANLLLNVPPDRTGRVPEELAATLLAQASL